jgi:thioredoxin
MPVRTLSQRDFSRQVLEAKEPVLLVFRAGWCAPSQQLAPILDDIADKYADRVRVLAVDVGDDLTTLSSNAICRQYKVTRVPVIMLLNEGRVKDTLGGATSPEVIVDMVERHTRPVQEVTAFDFETEVVQSPVPVLVHFHAAWCAQSMELLPVVESAAQQFRGRAKVARIEFGPETASLCARYGVRRVPVLAMFQGGEIKDQILGAMHGGTKVGERVTSCVGLTSTANVAQMVGQFAL